MNQDYNSNNGLYPVVSMGEWLLTIFVSCIPMVGLIMLIIFAFSSNINPSKKNYARMMLIVQVVFVGIYILLAAFGAFSVLNNPELYNTNYNF